MNRTEAKARAVELGISKDVARQYGNLNKTQTWLDAISAHEAQMQTQDAAEVQSDTDVLQAECEQPAVEVQGIQADAITTTVTPILSDPWDDIDKEAMQPAQSSLTDAIALTTTTPTCSDPWKAAESLETIRSAEIQPVYAVEKADVQVEVKMLPPVGDRQALSPEPSSNANNAVKPTASAYPLLLLCVVVWLVAWAVC